MLTSDTWRDPKPKSRVPCDDFYMVERDVKFVNSDKSEIGYSRIHITM